MNILCGQDILECCYGVIREPNETELVCMCNWTGTVKHLVMKSRKDIGGAEYFRVSTTVTPGSTLGIRVLSE